MDLKLNIDNNHGNRINSREFPLSQCEQIRQGEIRVQLGTTTCINVHRNHLCRRGKRGGIRLRSHLHKVRPLSANHGNLVRICSMVDISKYQPDNLLRLAQFNAQSIKNKDGIILEHLIASKIDVAVVTETWLKDDDGIWLQGSDINKGCYRTYTSNRSMKRGGGLAVVASKNFDVKLIFKSERQTFQIAKWKIAILSLVITLVGVYKPPNTSNFDFHDDFLDWISDMIALDKNIIIMGDFNHHINKQLDEDASNFMESMSSVGLVQNMEFGTHESDNILYLVFTESSSDFSVVKCRSGPFVLDHCMVICDIALAKPEIKCRHLTY